MGFLADTLIIFASQVSVVVVHLHFCADQTLIADNILRRRMDLLRQATLPQLRNQEYFGPADFLLNIRSVPHHVRADHLRNSWHPRVQLQTLPLAPRLDSSPDHGDRPYSILHCLFLDCQHSIR